MGINTPVLKRAVYFWISTRIELVSSTSVSVPYSYILNDNLLPELESRKSAKIKLNHK